LSAEVIFDQHEVELGLAFSLDRWRCFFGHRRPLSDDARSLAPWELPRQHCRETCWCRADITKAPLAEPAGLCLKPSNMGIKTLKRWRLNVSMDLLEALTGRLEPRRQRPLETSRRLPVRGFYSANSLMPGIGGVGPRKFRQHVLIPRCSDGAVHLSSA
jgi:hypothetical protein